MTGILRLATSDYAELCLADVPCALRMEDTSEDPIEGWQSVDQGRGRRLSLQAWAEVEDETNTAPL